MNPKIDLKTILDLHYKWRCGETSGSKADLSGTNLSGTNLSWANLSWADLSWTNLSEADLSEANLSGANLSGANLSWADLSKANLSEANLSEANLSKADLSWADLSGTNLSEADLSGANLSGANLSGANLSGANLSGANLSGANLKNCKQVELALAKVSHLPDGSFIGWKKCLNGVIVKLRIPEKARRSHGASRKCRAEFATVLEVIGAEVGISSHDQTVEYRVGKTVKADGWDEDRWNVCAQGIHFFITRLEAEAYEV